jgi:AbrB family looped-hinge helix DNA binding protein
MAQNAVCPFYENVIESGCVLRDYRQLGGRMETVTVSPKFQIVIPRTIRKSLDIQPGQKVQVLRYGNRIELIPLRPIQETRGFLKGIDTTVEREPDRV